MVGWGTCGKKRKQHPDFYVAVGLADALRSIQIVIGGNVRKEET